MMQGQGQGTLILRMVERALTHKNVPKEVYSTSTQQEAIQDESSAEMEITARLMSLKCLVELYTARTPEVEVLDTLQRIEALGPFSIDVLRSTNVDRAVTALMKRTESAAVRASACASLSEWKDLVRRNSRASKARASAAPLASLHNVAAEPIADRACEITSDQVQSSHVLPSMSAVVSDSRRFTVVGGQQKAAIEQTESSLNCTAEDDWLKEAELDPRVQALLDAGDESDCSDEAPRIEQGAEIPAELQLPKDGAQEAAASQSSVEDFLRICAKPVHWDNSSPRKVSARSSPSGRKNGNPLTPDQETPVEASLSSKSGLDSDTPPLKVSKRKKLAPILEHDKLGVACKRKAKEGPSLDGDVLQPKIARKGKQIQASQAQVPERQTNILRHVSQEARDSVAKSLRFDESPPPAPEPVPIASAAAPVSIKPLSGPASPAPAPRSPKASDKSPQTKIVPYKRRRLVGKQPPVMSLAVEIYCGKRLRGKQPPPTDAPTVSDRKIISVRGHYDALGVLRTATHAEIHAAYRKRALATHPDKGGDPKDFRRVKLAFEELIDKSRRTAYDRNLVFFGRRDGLGSESKDASAEKARAESPKKSSDCFGAARAAQYSLFSSESSAWSGTLGNMQDDVLKSLQKLLKGDKSGVPLEASDGSGKLQGWDGPTCITQHPKHGYKVEVGWADITVCTSFTKCLTQVIDWQIALLAMQSAAQIRMKTGSVKEPLVESELLHALEQEPALELSFAVKVSDGGCKGKKVSVSGIVSLQLAIDIRKRLLAAARGKNAATTLAAAKRSADREVNKEKKERRLLLQKLLIAVSEELQLRRVSPRARSSVQSRDAAAQGYDPRQSKAKRQALKKICDRPGRAQSSSSLAIVLHQASRQDSAKPETRPSVKPATAVGKASMKRPAAAK